VSLWSEPVTKDFIVGTVFGMALMAGFVVVILWAFHG
jgi:hypothetical protein